MPKFMINQQMLLLKWIEDSEKERKKQG